MRVRLARTAGFCMGVRLAMETVLAHANRTKEPIYTYGPLIHNTQVLDLLESKGIVSVDSVEGLHSGTIVVRAHGIPPGTRFSIRSCGLHLVDATCPRVARVQSIIRAQSRNGRDTIIAGDRDHAEVIGLLGYSESAAHVISDLQEISSLPELERPFLVAQTTHNAESFREIISSLRLRYPDLVVFDTICEATHERQEEVRMLASQVDAMVVVGGYHSGNTQRLAQISESCGVPTFHVETEADLDRTALSRMEVIGVTAGASTPNWMIRNVVKEVEALRGSGESRAGKFLRNLSQAAVQSNIPGALGAFAFAHAAAVIGSRPPTFVFPFLAGLYVFAVHISNRFLDHGASAYNDPKRAAFLSSHRTALLSSGIIAAAVGILLAVFVGAMTFLAFSLMILAGVLYSFPIFPAGVKKRFSLSKIKDIPGSRSFSEALAWTAVIGLLPLLDRPSGDFPAEVTTVGIVLLLSYIRSILFDVFQAQGDLIVGTETLPIILGEARTLKIIKWLIGGSAAISILGPASGAIRSFGFIMLLPVSMLFFCVRAYERNRTYPGSNLEALVDWCFISSGFLAVCWQVIQWLK